jgi:uncharacterized membrane protein
MDNHEDESESTRSAMVDQNVDAILALHNADELAMTRHQRAVERVVQMFVLPAFLLSIVTGILVWIGWNLKISLSGEKPWDPAPFPMLQTTVSIVALLMSSLIIITQHRQGKIAERNAHLDLQVNLLVDQKVAKIIQLLEEMRSDSPHLRNRIDLEADEMQIAVNPTHVASVIAEKMADEQVDSPDDPEP